MYNINFLNPFIIIFLSGTILTFSLNHFLEFLNFKTRKKILDRPDRLPQELNGYPASECFDPEKLKNIVNYKSALYFSWIPYSIVALTLSLSLVLTGFYPWIFDLSIKISGLPTGFWQTYLCFFLFYFFASLPEGIVSIPFSIYDEFKIEKKFGFSNMTIKLWITDFIKSNLISLIVSGILILPVTAILMFFPKTWWIFVTIILFCFTLTAQIIYPLIIAPLFNKFTPLKEGELKDSIIKLLEEKGFKSAGIFVMDASKRSGHSNAYFGGMGKSKRIVLYDTLIKQLSTEELTAVLAHEIGHYKKKHILKRFLLMIPVEFLVLFVLNILANIPSLYEGFGFYQINTIGIQSVQFIGLFLSIILYGSVQEIFSPLFNILSRKDEYEADNFAAELTGNPDYLINALIKLNSENLSDLIPSKLYAFWNYSHPTLIERIINLKKFKSK